MRGSKARYVDTPLGARRPGGPGRPFELADGQTIDTVMLTLPPAGVITGASSTTPATSSPAPR